MRTRTGMLLAGGLLVAASLALAQRPGGPEAASKSAEADRFVARMMEFDQDKDGKLTKAEVTDERLHRLFERADANKDGFVTKEELTALAAREPIPGRGGPPGFGPPGGGPGGFMMGPPRPGEVLPPMFRQALRLTPEQREQVDELQKEVDARLDKILNVEQKKQLREMRERGPGRFGPPGGRPGGGAPPPPPPPDRPQ
jgi:hypothetical protein